MGLLDRIARIVRAGLTNVVNNAEDPEKILVKTVTEMQADLIQIRQGVAQAIATQKRTERQFDHANTNAQEYYNRAELALQKGNESLAREALSQRKTYLGTAQMMERQLQEQKTVITRLKENMRVLESKLAEAKTKKDMYIARARSAQASQRLNEMLGQVSGKNTGAAFEQMEAKILELEAKSEAIAEVNAIANTDPLAERFASLEQPANDIDQEIAALKAKLDNQLPPAQ